MHFGLTPLKYSQRTIVAVAAEPVFDLQDVIRAEALLKPDDPCKHLQAPDQSLFIGSTSGRIPEVQSSIPDDGRSTGTPSRPRRRQGQVKSAGQPYRLISKCLKMAFRP